MYCTVSDVENYFLNKEFKSGGYLVNQEVQAFIAQETAVIDAVLKTRYSLPITDQDDLLILKMINEKLVAGTLDEILREKDSEGKFDRGRNLRKEGQNWLDKILKGEIILDTTEKDSVIKFNQKDSKGNVVEKRFKDSDIQPKTTIQDRERKTVIRVT